MTTHHFSTLQRYASILILLTLTACTKAVIPETTVGNDEAFEQFLAEQWDYSMRNYPEYATSVGHPGYDHLWTDNSMAAIERRKQDTVDALAALQRIDPATLDEDNRLNYALYLQKLKRSVDSQQFPYKLLAISQLSGVQHKLANTLSTVPKHNLEDYENILKRLRSYPTVIENNTLLLREGLAQGVTPPRVTLDDIPQQIEAQTKIEDHPVMQAFEAMPANISAADQRRIRNQARTILETEVIPAYRKYHTFIVEEYLPNCRNSIAHSDLPDGQNWYAHLIRMQTTTELTQQEIHQIGLDEVARLRKEFIKLKEEIGFKGDMESFTAYMRDDPKFKYDSREELLTAYRAFAKQADFKLTSVVTTFPRLPYGVEPIEAYREKTAPAAYYYSGSLKTGVPGTFKVNTYDLPSRKRWELQALTLHETVPGHHLQIALANEQEELPNFRRYGGYTAYSEGWGLYSELLGYDMGLYEDPTMRYGQLTYEMWRAVRLVVDTGMHARGWSRERAIDYFLQNAGKSRYEATVEIDRYIIWPGQALAYKIGQMKISQLRSYSQQALGDAFDLRAFHDVVLANGPLPLDVLETVVKDWVTATKNGDDPDDRRG